MRQRRCGPGEVLLPPKVGRDLLMYPNAPNSAIRAVGSSAVDGRCVSAKLVREAAQDLGDFTVGTVDPRWTAKAWRLREFLLHMSGRD